MQLNDLVGGAPPTGLSPDTTEVQLLLGQMYLNKGEFTQAFGMFAVAAQSGQAKALNMLGRAYEQGWGVPRSVVQALTYFEAAAGQDYGWAHFNLGDLYLSGHGLTANPERAFGHYVKAARLGVNKALNMLGTLCENGVGAGLPDKVKARLYFKAGAEAQDCWAAFNMGRLALEEQDVTTAAYWFERSLPYGFPEYWVFIKQYLHQEKIPILRTLLAKTHTCLQAALPAKACRVS